MSRKMIGVVLSVFAFALAAAAQGQDPVMGTWKLNLAKSKYDPGPPQRSLTLRIEPSGPNGMKVTTDGVDGQGQPTHTEYTANFDGKDYAIKGSTSYDTVTLKRIDPYTRVRIDKKGGNVVRMLRASVSKDGKTLTVASVGVNAQGQAAHDIAVYDKQ